MSRMLLPAMSILRIRRAGAMMLEAAHEDAKSGQWLLAEMHAKTAAEVINAAGRLMNGVESGFEVLKRDHIRARGVTDKRHLGKSGRLMRAAKALIARELARTGHAKREQLYYAGRRDARSRRR